VALSFAPALSQFVPGDKQVHSVFVVLVVSIGLLAFVSGYRKHRKLVVFLPMAAGVWAIGLGAFGGSSLGPLAENGITILGSTLIITAHGLNRTFCKYCDSCTSENGASQMRLVYAPHEIAGFYHITHRRDLQLGYCRAAVPTTISLGEAPEIDMREDICIP